MNSIKKKLSRYISASISVLLITILLATDISVDTWISSEFDRAMVNKSSLLVTLVSEDLEEIDFDFAGEFMPEFEGKDDAEYFQLWHDNKVFERSDTLELFETHDLPKLDVKSHETKIENITLPDGRSGRMLFTKFLPQIDSDIREEFGVAKEDFAKTQTHMELAYAISNEGLEQVLWFVDIIFIVTSVIAVVSVHIIVSTVVERGLRPIESLNNELQLINLNSEVAEITTEKLPLELKAMAYGINHFIKENKLLYSREKRITSDIAHELKTPIAELLNLSEVAIKFPDDKQITEGFSEEVLQISERLRNIVNGILLLQKSSGAAELKTQNVDLDGLIQTLINRENKSNRDIVFNCDANGKIVHTNFIAIETILSNLVNNALFYSPDETTINIDVSCENEKQSIIKISNISAYHYTEEELSLFFEPLWQKDESRTSTQRYGLGLAIVKSYCDKIDASLAVSLEAEQRIVFSITI